MIETLIPKWVIEKARAHEVLHDYLFSHPREGEPAKEFRTPWGADLMKSGHTALDALRDDIQDAITEVAKEHDARFWFETFGKPHSTCKYSITGFCNAYHPNDGPKAACSYAYVHDVECCVCLRTKAVEDAYPELFRELVVDNFDTKGQFYGEV